MDESLVLDTPAPEEPTDVDPEAPTDAAPEGTDAYAESDSCSSVFVGNSLYVFFRYYEVLAFPFP